MSLGCPVNAPTLWLTDTGSTSLAHFSIKQFVAEAEKDAKPAAH